MKTGLCFVIGLSCLTLCRVASAQGDSAALGRTVLSVQARLDAIAQAKAVLAPRPVTWKQTVKDLPDPFYRSNTPTFTDPDAAAAEAAARRSQRTAMDVLESAATSIKPRLLGTMENPRGDGFFLLMDNRRLGVGDEISVTIDGLLYKVSLSSIERNSYTLKYQDHELKRDFK